MTFCGQIIGSGKRRINSERFTAIERMQPPQTKSDVRKMLGLFGWYRDYIPQYAEITRPLTDLTSNKRPNKVIWTELEQKSFELLKQSLCNAVRSPLNLIDWSKEFNIYTDASDISIAAVISQTDADGNEKPISFYSKKLNDTQKNWSTIEREAFAVLEALNKFKNLIYGFKINLFSDHNPLAYLTDSVPKSPKLIRWALALQNFDINFCYKPGKSPAMSVPDYLSRIRV